MDFRNTLWYRYNRSDRFATLLISQGNAGRVLR